MKIPVNFYLKYAIGLLGLLCSTHDYVCSHYTPTTRADNTNNASLAIIFNQIAQDGSSSFSYEDKDKEKDEDDDEEDDEFYVDLALDSDLLMNILLQNSSVNESIHIKSYKEMATKPFTPLSGDNESLLLLTAKLFFDFKFYFIMLSTLVFFLIASTLVLITANFFFCGKKKQARSYTCSSSAKRCTLKKNASFDAVNSALLSNRGLTFKSFSRSPSQLIVDHDYQFENFTKPKKTKLSSFENIYELPYMEAIEIVDGARKEPNLTTTMLHLETPEVTGLKFKTFPTKNRIENVAMKVETSLVSEQVRVADSSSSSSTNSSLTTDDDTRLFQPYSICSNYARHHNSVVKMKKNGTRHEAESTLISFSGERGNVSTGSKSLASSQIDRLKIVRV